MLQFHICNPADLGKIQEALGTVTKNTPTKPFETKPLATWKKYHKIRNSIYSLLLRIHSWPEGGGQSDDE